MNIKRIVIASITLSFAVLLFLDKIVEVKEYEKHKILCCSCGCKKKETKIKKDNNYIDNLLNKNKKTILTLWTIQLGLDNDFILDVIYQFEKNNKNVKVKWIDIPYSEGEKRILASILSSVPPDLINVTNDFALTLSKKGALSQIDNSLFDNYVPVLNKATINNNKHFAFPFYATSSVTILNKDLYSKSQLNYVPKKYEDIFKSAKKVKKNTKKYIMLPTLTENDTFLKILKKYDIDPMSNDPNKNLLSKESYKLFSDFKYLYKNNLIPKSSINQGHLESLEKYMAQETMLIVSGANFLNQINENALNVFKNSNVYPQITGSSGKYDFSLMSLIIPLKAKNPDLAKQLAKMLTNEENQIKFAKKTLILPVDKNALQYFKNNKKTCDIYEKARQISAKQLDNALVSNDFDMNNKKINEIINLCVEKILLNNNPIEEELINAQKKINEYKNERK